MGLPAAALALGVLAALLLQTCHASPAHATVRSAREVVAGLLDGNVIAARVAQANRAAAARESMMDRAAQMARSLGGQANWTPRRLPKPRNHHYVDLSRVVTSRAQASLTPDLDAPGADYPRMPSHYYPMLEMMTFCPGANSVTNYGAVGDGSTPNEGPLWRANDALDILYFPPGTYAINSPVRLTKPIVLGAGAVIQLNWAGSLTLSEKPRKWFKDQPMFTGAGGVTFLGQANEIRPDWFPGSDSDKLERSVASCGSKCLITITHIFQMSRAWILSEKIGILATNAGLLYGGDSGNNPIGEGIVLFPGTYTLPLQFGTLLAYKNFMIKIPGGVLGAEIQLATIVKGTDAIMFSPGEGTGNLIKDVWVTHLTATTDIQNTAVFRTTGPGQTIENCVVRGNFLINPAHYADVKANAGLSIIGPAAPILKATSVIYQAIDVTKQDDQNTPYSFLNNEAGTPAEDVVFHVEAWAGGLSGAENIARGAFNRLKLNSHMSINAPSEANMLVDFSGSNNLITLGSYNSAAFERELAATQNKTAFGPAMTEQSFYFRVPITKNWKGGEERTYYLWAALAKAVDASKIKCIVFRAYNLGIVCSEFENQNAQEEGRISVTLKNSSNSTITVAQMPVHRFAIQVGP